jgi:hypothetical protein
VIPEAPFLFSMAALNASMAGLAGLVAGLRRGTELAPIDVYRLRQIVEFAFANVLLTVANIPLVTITGSLADSARIGAIAAFIYLVWNALVLFRRLSVAGIPRTGTWYRIVFVVDGVVILAIAATLLSGSFAIYALLLIGLLARPMVAFLFVLQSFERG